ncbi:MAG TPA: dNTP triphosphohydrolase [Lichenihabitans sp.]|nr:dNTP triphosphohydrolase [Lichenihabitans sp.]
MTERSHPQPSGPLRIRCGAGTVASRGRLVREPPSATRTEFQRDRDRIIHCGAFRRLALKTQVFLPEESDHYRTRLTHTIEVAQIARSISRVLGLDDDLTEALALAHDLGHSPFGHTGEDALDAALGPAGGFDHNAQTLRIVTRLERRYPAFDGLNLTWETLEGLVKRNGPLVDAEGRSLYGRPLPAIFSELDARLGFDLATCAGTEAQVASVADDMAYNAHDLEDGLDAGLFDLPDMAEVPILAELIGRIAAETPNLDRNLTVRALIRAIVGVFVEDAIAESLRRLGAGGAAVAGSMARSVRPAIGLSPALAAASTAIKLFLRERMYRHPRLLDVRARAFDIMTDLATRLVGSPQELPSSWAAQAVAGPGAPKTMRLVADYLASLTDRGAVAEHRRLFRSTPDLR